MKRSFLGKLAPVTVAIMLIVSLAVLSGLCVKALTLERKANELSRAVVLAGSAADCFYSADNALELAQLLDGEVCGENLISADDDDLTLTVTLPENGRMTAAEIEISAGEATVYTLSCRRAPETEGNRYDG